MGKIFLLILIGNLVTWFCLVGTSVAAESVPTKGVVTDCEKGFAKVLVINTSEYRLSVATLEEAICVKTHIATIESKTKKHLCLDSKYLLSIATIDDDKKELAYSATDLLNDVVVTIQKEKGFDVTYEHLTFDNDFISQEVETIDEQMDKAIKEQKEEGSKNPPSDQKEKATEGSPMNPSDVKDEKTTEKEAPLFNHEKSEN